MSVESLSNPEAIVAKAACCVAIGAALYVAVSRHAPGRDADPWTDELDASVKRRDAVPVCVNCLFPQPEHPWFCPHCAFPTGEYVTLLPFVQNFALGEAFRRGVSGPPERRWGASALAWLASAMVYRPFAALYWFWIWRRQHGTPIGDPRHVGWDPDEDA